MSNLMDLINKRKQEVSRIKTIKPADGRNRYRILPSWRVDDTNGPKAQFWMDFGQHFIKDAAGKVKAVYICTDKTFGRPCPICDEVARGIANSTNDADAKRIKDAASSARVLLNVLHLDGPTPNTVQTLELAPSAFNGKKGVGGILSLFTDWPKLADIGGQPDGCADVIIEKTGSGLDTNYGVSAVPTQITVTQEMLKNVPDLDKFVAQENDQGRARALASVSAITGLLPAPAQRTSLADAAAAFDDVPTFETAVAAPAPTAPAPTVQAAAPAPVAAAPVPAPQPAVAAVADNNDLEELLKGL